MEIKKGEGMKGIKKVFVHYQIEVYNINTGDIIRAFEQNFSPNETKILIDTIKEVEKNWIMDCKDAIRKGTRKPHKPDYQFDINVNIKKETRFISMVDFMQYSTILDK